MHIREHSHGVRYGGMCYASWLCSLPYHIYEACLAPKIPLYLGQKIEDSAAILHYNNMTYKTFPYQ